MALLFTRCLSLLPNSPCWTTSRESGLTTSHPTLITSMLSFNLPSFGPHPMVMVFAFYTVKALQYDRLDDTQRPLSYLSPPLFVSSACPSHVPHVTCFQAPSPIRMPLPKCSTVFFLCFFKSNAMIFQEEQTNKKSNERNTSIIFSDRLWLMSPKITPITLVIMHVDSCQVYCQHKPPNLSHLPHPRHV